MKVETLDHFPASPAWDALFSVSGAEDFYSTREWYEVYTGTVARPGSLRIVAAIADDGAIAAALPLTVLDDERKLGKDALQSLTNYYSCLYAPLAAQDRELAAAGLRAIVDRMVSEADWYRLELRPLADDLWAADALQTAFTAHGLTVARLAAFGNWIEPTAEVDFDTYFNGRRKKLRHTFRQKTKQLEKEYAVDLRIVREPNDVAAALDDYNAVYATSWKQAEPYPDFIPTLADALARAGKLRLGILRLDDRPVAAQLWYVHDDKAFIYKLAYDPDFSKYSVGTVLTMRLVEHCLDVDHVRCIDFLSGDDDHKKQWMSERRQRIALEVVNSRTLPGRMLLLRRRLAAVRDRLRPPATATEGA